MDYTFIKLEQKSLNSNKLMYYNVAKQNISKYYASSIKKLMTNYIQTWAHLLNVKSGLESERSHFPFLLFLKLLFPIYDETNYTEIYKIFKMHLKLFVINKLIINYIAYFK